MRTQMQMGKTGWGVSGGVVDAVNSRSTNIRSTARLASLAFLLALTACGRTTDIAELAPTSVIDPTTTASTTKPSGVSSDQAMIASVIGGAKAIGDNGESPMVLSWANEQTGNSGTITAIEQAITDGDKRCFSFLSTLENYTGISLYDGKACELSAGQWVLSWFRPKSVG
ncbi:MAG: RT0821/Lpp0805 family surface protein [Pseudomonadota bacterium]